MKVNVSMMRADGSLGDVVECNALAYPFPKKGTQPEGYSLTVDGETAGAGLVANTGFGTAKSPCYTYFMWGGKSYYLPKSVGALPKGSVITVVVPAAAPAPVAPAPIEAPAEVEAPTPKAAPKSRRKPKVEAAAA